MNHNASINSQKQSLNVSQSDCSGKKPSPQNFIKQQHDLDQTLDPSKIMEYIQLLQEYEKNCIQENNFREAELVTKRIEELQQHELVYRSLAVVEKNKEEINELEKLNLQQFNEFNQIWDQIIEEHVQHLKQLEENMIDQHKQEQEQFENEVGKVVIPKCKYSKDILNMRYVLENMIKTKKYAEAHDIKEKIAVQEKHEEEKWNKKYMEKYDKKKLQVWQRQKNEIEALKVKLENSLQEKIKIRTIELEKLLQKFQNMKNELEVKQNQELSKLQVMNNKTMSKITTNRSLNSSVYTSTLDASKIN